MESASGYYLNLFQEKPALDLFVIFNEANPEPTGEELTKIQDLLETMISEGALEQPRLFEFEIRRNLALAIENTGLPCVEWGVQVVINYKEKRS